MANPTSNFGWQMPTSTDLVTDLPADFETFGQAVDTSLADLKGGTTGQVLSKASNTDMDFTWVAQDDSNAIQNAIVDAKGDLIAATAADTPARLAVGNNGETLVADSSTATGLRWQVPKTQNAVYNSGYDVWQRGTSSTANASAAGNGYSADRWQSFYTGGSMTTSQQATGDTTNLPNVRYCARVQRNSGQTTLNNVGISQTLETADTIRFVGQTVTFSFWARKGANFSASGNVLNAVVATGTGTDQNVLFSFTNSSNLSVSAVAITSTWQRFTATATVPTTATEIGFYIYYAATGTAGANDYFEVTGVQLETGSVATPFNRQSGSIQGELAACQRYYVRFGTGANTYEQIGFGMASDVTYVIAQMPLPVSMRVTPSAIDFSTLRVVDTQNASTVSSVTFDNANRPSTLRPILKFTTSGSLTQYRPYFIEVNNSTSGYLGLSAEL